MTNRNLIVASLLALSIPGFATAQTTTTQPSVDQPSQTQPATPEVTQPDSNASQQTMPSDSNTAQQPAPTTNENTAQQPPATTTTEPNTAEQPAPTDTNKSSAEAPATTAATSVIVSEADLSGIQPWTANEFIGKTVYTTANENVGEINDLVFGNDGKIVGVVIGVGGFLGIGEKDVLVSLESIRMTKQEGSDVTQLVVDASKETLDNAPGFDRVAKRYLPPEPATPPAATDTTNQTNSGTTQN
jgi:sporulation protein YlmC with PRC-barrel domain